MTSSYIVDPSSIPEPHYFLDFLDTPRMMLAVRLGLLGLGALVLGVTLYILLRKDR